MDIFNAHKEDYIELVREIKTKITQIETTYDAIERNKLLKDIKNKIQEGERILRSMKLTKPNVGLDGEALNMMIETFRSDLQSLNQEFQEKDVMIEQLDRKQLLNQSGDSDDDFQSQKLTMKLIKTTDILKEAKGMGDQTVGIAQGVIIDLDRQGRQMDKSMLTLEGMHDSLDQASQIMSKIWTKMLTTQGIRYLIIVILIAANVSIVYMGFFWSPSRDNTPAPTINTTIS
jgi:hypothetical protein